jgi:iron complex outermembrane recepter protein
VEDDMSGSNNLSGHVVGRRTATVAAGVMGVLAAATASGQQDHARVELAEIVVTAQKREQAIADIPFSVSALDGGTLNAMGAARFEDFARSLPGLAFTLLGPGQSRFTIRGVSTFSGVSVVGLYIDESPIASTINYTQPSFTLYDLDRVELLRGPQGTLYGEGSLGGTLRYITARPDVDNFIAKAETRVSQTEKGGTNYHVNGAVNVPIQPGSLALRLTGSYLDDAGFIDNLPLGLKDWNDTQTSAARAKLLWQPTERLSFELGGLYQKIDHGGPAVESFDRPPNSLENNDTAEQFYEDTVEQVALTAHYRFDAAELTSATAYIERSLDQGSQARGPTGTGVPRYTLFDADFSVLTQEFRLASTNSGALQWIAGAFYKSYEVDELRSNFSVSPGGAPIGAPNLRQSEFDQVALFGEVEYAITPRLSGTIGLRWFSEDQEAINNVGQKFEVDAEKTIGRAALRFNATDTTMFYTSFSQGFRSGGVNLFAIPGVDNTFEPDETNNYEIGTKLLLADGRVSLDVALYRIDWKDMQTFVARPDLGPFVFFVQNDSEAEVEGAELEVRWALARDIEFGATGSYTDARYTKDAPFEGPAGNRLPKVPEYTASAYLTGSRALSADWTAYGRVDFQYVGTFPELGNNIDESGNYSLVNVRAGLNRGPWQFELFVDNVNDTRADLFQRRTTEFGMYRNQPRTYGLIVRWDR